MAATLFNFFRRRCDVHQSAFAVKVSDILISYLLWYRMVNIP